MCVREFPGLEAVRREFADTDIRFLAVSLDPDVDNIRQTALRLGVGFTMTLAADEVLGPLRLSRIPSTVFVNRDGVIIAAANGERTPAFFRRRFRELVN